MTIKQLLRELQRRFRLIMQRMKNDYPEVYRFIYTRERWVAVIVLLLFGIITIQIFALQIVEYNQYSRLLDQNHSLTSTMKADRGHIYINDTSQSQPIKLTENVTLYNIFIDPGFVKDKEKVIETITPLITQHLCQINVFKQVDHEQCVKNIELFTQQNYLPPTPYVMYLGQGISTGDDMMAFDMTGYTLAYEKVLSGFTDEKINQVVSQRLDEMIKIGERKYNYVGYYSDPILMKALRESNAPGLYIYQNNYVFIEPKAVNDLFVRNESIRTIENIFITQGYVQDALRVAPAFKSRSYRYVRLVTNVNPSIVEQLNTLKRDLFSEKDPETRTPLLHGLGTEAFVVRHYPYGNFMSHILGYMSATGEPTYGVESYFDPLLKGIDGRIEGRASSLIGQLGANDIMIENVQDGYDVYLTIDPVIQKQAEKTIAKYRERFVADSVSVLVYDPWSGHVIASANAPDFDPNNYGDLYELQPLSPDQAQLSDNITYLDFPIYVKVDGKTRVATIAERSDPTLEKYVAKNPLGPNLFVDKNIAYPYEPGSIFKTFTHAIGLDQNEISLYDRYEDRESEVKVGPFTIKNANVEACRGQKTFLYALQYSCNVGMVRIAQRLTMHTFYNYMDKLGFGQMTNIELAGEQPGFVESVGSVSVARFFNNVFGQGLLVTPIQLAAGYGAMLNGGTYLKPTILSKICERGTTNCQQNDTQIIRQIFEPRISELVKESLLKVLEIPENAKYAALPNYNVGGKSGTSQISFRGRYRGGNGWTNGSFVGIVTSDNLQYIVVVQVRRPRSTQRGNQTAGVIFKDLASFLINYGTLRGEKFEVK